MANALFWNIGAGFLQALPAGSAWLESAEIASEATSAAANFSESFFVVSEKRQTAELFAGSTPIGRHPASRISLAGEDLLHPTNAIPIPASQINEETIRECVAAFRSFVKQKIKEIKEAFRAGEDPKVLIETVRLNLQEGEMAQALFRLNAITQAYGAKIGDDEYWKVVNHNYRGALTAYNCLALSLENEHMRNVLLLQETDDTMEHPYLLNEIINDIRDILKGRIIERKLTFDNQVERTSQGLIHEAQQDIAEQMIEELINNATKYAEKNVALRWDAQTRTLFVVNDGPGIPEGFDPWEKGKRGHHPEIPGTGLGLAIAKENAQREGWEVGYTSKLAETVFWIRFPQPLG